VGSVQETPQWWAVLAVQLLLVFILGVAIGLWVAIQSTLRHHDDGTLTNRFAARVAKHRPLDARAHAGSREVTAASTRGGRTVYP
jgi:hypothetical protein